jgi:hypothetical protein
MPYGPVEDEKLLAPARAPYMTTRKGIGRDMEAARLKALGWSLPDIAVAIGVDDPQDPQKSSDRAAAAVKRAMAAAVRFSHEEYRLMDLAGLEELESRLWQMLADKHVLVQQGRIIYQDSLPLEDARLKLEIMGQLASVKRDKAKLMGYTAASKIEISSAALDEEIARLRAETAGNPE